MSTPPLHPSSTHARIDILYALALPGLAVVTSTLAWPVWLFALLCVICVIFFQLVKVRTVDHQHSLFIGARSILLGLSWLLIFAILPYEWQRIVYAVLSIPVLYVMNQVVWYPDETSIAAHTILGAAGVSVGVTALEFYFRVGGFWLTLAVYAFTFLLAYATYVLTPQPASVQRLTSALVALYATQAYIVTLFLPFHYTVLGFLVFLGFYLPWLFGYYWQYQSLTVQKIRFYLFFMGLLLLITLAVTPWQLPN